MGNHPYATTRGWHTVYARFGGAFWACFGYPYFYYPLPNTYNYVANYRLTLPKILDLRR
jgi:hypothetical protein